jgi:hypothetical protein
MWRQKREVLYLQVLWPKPVLWIRICFIEDPDPALLVNAGLYADVDPDPGFWWPKIEQNLQLEKFKFFDQKLQFTYL